MSTNKEVVKQPVSALDPVELTEVKPGITSSRFKALMFTLLAYVISESVPYFQNTLAENPDAVWVKAAGIALVAIAYITTSYLRNKNFTEGQVRVIEAKAEIVNTEAKSNKEIAVGAAKEAAKNIFEELLGKYAGSLPFPAMVPLSGIPQTASLATPPVETDEESGVDDAPNTPTNVTEENLTDFILKNLADVPFEAKKELALKVAQTTAS